MIGVSNKLMTLVLCVLLRSAVSEQVAAGAPKVTRHGAASQLAADAVTQDWPNFLGPTHDGRSAETRLLAEWPADGPPLIWSLRTGSGYASPAIHNGRLVYLHRVDDREVVDCVDAETGASHWRFSYPSDYRDEYGFSNGPRSSPVIDHHHVYTLSAAGLLHCLDLATGNLVWKLDTMRRFKRPQNYFGVGTTPLLDGDRLILHVGATGGPCVVALERDTGDIIWQSGDQWGESYSTPVPATMGGQPRLFVLAGGKSRPPTGGLLVLDSRTGAEDFRFPFRSKRYESVNASSPVIHGGQVFISSSYGTGGVALRRTGPGEYTVAWRTEDLGAHFATPIVIDGYLYGVTGSRRNATALVCLNWKSGQLKWRHVPEWPESVVRNGKRETVHYTAGLGSFVYADGAFLLLGEQGHLARVELTPRGYRERCRARLFRAGETWCAPVLSRGLLYVCQNRPDTKSGEPPRLLCYDLRTGGRDKFGDEAKSEHRAPAR